jgi:hypothetical protein
MELKKERLEKKVWDFEVMKTNKLEPYGNSK